MNNPLENPSSQPPKPEREKSTDPGYVKYTPEEMAAARKRLEDEYAEPETPKEKIAEYEQRLQEVLGLVKDFETNHPLETLFAITELDETNTPIRDAARRDLVIFWKALNSLNTEMALPQEVKVELDSQYKKLSQAVGILHQGKVDHTR